MTDLPTTLLSVVIPVRNEEPSVRPLFAEILRTLEGFADSFEIIVVDDGSTDGTRKLLEEVCERDERVRALMLSGRRGKAQALTAGIHAAKGEVVVTIDGDLQNDPADIPKLVAALRDGADAVSGWRQTRHVPILSRRLPSVIANRIISYCTGIRLHDHGCGLKAYTRTAARAIVLDANMHRYLPSILPLAAERVTEVRICDRPRPYGESKYGSWRIVEVLRDLPLLHHHCRERRSKLRAWVEAAFVGALGIGSVAIIAEGASLVRSTAIVSAAMTGSALVWLGLLRWRRAVLLGARVPPTLSVGSIRMPPMPRLRRAMAAASEAWPQSRAHAGEGP